MSNFKVVLQLVLFAVVSIVALGGFEEAGAAVTGCGQVVRQLSPCINYVIRGGAVPAQCCTGVRTLYGQAQTTADRQTVCSCIKSAAAAGGSGYSNLNLGLAAGLPSKCGVSIPYKINPSTNCNTIK